MTRFVIGTPVQTTAATVVVDAGLPAGLHGFRLVVVDNSGNASVPSEAVVSVQPLTFVPASPATPVMPVMPVMPVTPVIHVTPAGPIVTPVRAPSTGRTRNAKGKPRNKP